MTSKAEIQTYARELADVLREVSGAQDRAKYIIASAKDAGVNVKALRKVSREMVMDSDERAKLYDDEGQLDMFRAALGLTQPALVEAAE